MGVLKHKKKATGRRAALQKEQKPEAAPLFLTEIRLSARAYEQILKEMESPPPPNEELQRAAEWYKRIRAENGELQIQLERPAEGETHS